MQKMKLSPKARSNLEAVIERFRDGSIASPLAESFLSASGAKAPTRTGWNRLLMALAGTGDARTWNQWAEVGRHPSKGTKALILVRPMFVKGKDADEEDSGALIGFSAFPAFRLEDTEGDPLVTETPPPPPLLEVAQMWGIRVNYVPFSGDHLGSYTPATGHETIALCVREPHVFLHELAHAAHARVLQTRGRSLQGGQDALQESVAELASVVLSHMVGLPSCEGNAYRYLSSYAGGDKGKLLDLCSRALTQTVEVVDMIMFHGLMEQKMHDEEIEQRAELRAA
jgi:hypothetical protein